MAVLTDGQEWSFYLLGAEGRYEERRVYKLDVLERSPDESTNRLQRYLQYQRVTSGDALSAARHDYQDADLSHEIRQIASSMPRAWHELLSNADESLVELLADKVKDLCGYKPDSDACSRFIQTKVDSHSGSDYSTYTEPPATALPSRSPVPTPSIAHRETGFSFRGQFHSARSAREVIQKILITFAEGDPEFLERFAARKHGRKRRFIARSRNELYPGRPDLANQAVKLVQGWWMGTNYGRGSIKRKARLACEVADVEFGKDLVVSL